MIYAQNRAQYLEWGNTDERWYVEYAAIAPHPNKKVLIFYEESTLERAVLKTYRYLALHKNAWGSFAEEQS